MPSTISIERKRAPLEWRSIAARAAPNCPPDRLHPRREMEKVSISVLKRIKSRVVLKRVSSPCADFSSLR